MSPSVVVLAFLGGVGFMCRFVIAVVAYSERQSPDFSDAPCVPDGACASGRQCAMHDTAFRWVAKGPRPC